MKIINIITSKQFQLFMLLLLSTQANLMAQYYAEDYQKLGDKAIFMSYINTGEKAGKANPSYVEQRGRKGIP